MRCALTRVRPSISSTYCRSYGSSRHWSCSATRDSINRVLVPSNAGPAPSTPNCIATWGGGGAVVPDDLDLGIWQILRPRREERLFEQVLTGKFHHQHRAGVAHGVAAVRFAAGGDPAGRIAAHQFRFAALQRPREVGEPKCQSKQIAATSDASDRSSCAISPASSDRPGWRRQRTCAAAPAGPMEAHATPCSDRTRRPATPDYAKMRCRWTSSGCGSGSEQASSYQPALPMESRCESQAGFAQHGHSRLPTCSSPVV